MSEYLDSYCSKCRKKYDVGVVDCFFPYESDNNKCLECFKAEYQDIKADNIKLQAQLTQERERRESAEEALRFYASNSHFDYLGDVDFEPETVSGEPINWLSGGITDSEFEYENGGIAREHFKKYEDKDDQ